MVLLSPAVEILTEKSEPARDRSASAVADIRGVLGRGDRCARLHGRVRGRIRSGACRQMPGCEREEAEENGGSGAAHGGSLPGGALFHLAGEAGRPPLAVG